MRKLLLAFSISLLGSACFAAACPQALPTSHPSFCPSFRTSATCHCIAGGLPAGMCQDMNAIYARMISIFGSVEKACEYQHDTTTRNCIDDWSCYRKGGRDSFGNLCSSTGQACS